MAVVYSTPSPSCQLTGAPYITHLGSVYLTASCAKLFLPCMIHSIPFHHYIYTFGADLFQCTSDSVKDK